MHCVFHIRFYTFHISITLVFQPGCMYSSTPSSSHACTPSTYILRSSLLHVSLFPSITIPFTSNLLYWHVTVAHVFVPKHIANLTTVMYNFTFSFSGIFLSDNTPLHFFPIPSAAHTVCPISISIPPFYSTTVPRYLHVFAFKLYF